jgi:hypothetical protein
MILKHRNKMINEFVNEEKCTCGDCPECNKEKEEKEEKEEDAGQE